LQAQIELGRLLKEASEGRTPETDSAATTTGRAAVQAEAERRTVGGQTEEH
jgi:hypothetical protein